MHTPDVVEQTLRLWRSSPLTGMILHDFLISWVCSALVVLGLLWSLRWIRTSTKKILTPLCLTISSPVAGFFLGLVVNQWFFIPTLKNSEDFARYRASVERQCPKLLDAWSKGEVVSVSRYKLADLIIMCGEDPIKAASASSGSRLLVIQRQEVYFNQKSPNTIVLYYEGVPKAAQTFP